MITDEWSDRAACRGEDTEIFFPLGHPPDATLDLCRACPVRGDCLDIALARGESGIWGGTSEEQRRYIRAQALAGPATEASSR